jgi:hypothetical protein
MTKQNENERTGKGLFMSSTKHNDDDAGNEEEEEDDDDDEFFGSQEDDDACGTGGNGYGALGQHETLAKDRDLATIGYFESYDETKEERVQEGFEAGYQQTFEASRRVGELFGQCMAHAEFSHNNHNKEAVKRQSLRISRHLHEFLTAFQRGSDDPTFVKESLAALEEEMSQARIE